jgi:hypothetical protein
MSAYGLHKAAGGIAKRRRETLARLDTMTCRLHPKRTAAGLIETPLLDLLPACSACVAYGREHGYEVIEPEASR